MIPSKPDPDNTGEGKRRTFSFFARGAAPPSSFIYLFMPEVSINQQQFQLPEGGCLADVLSLLQIGQADGIAIAVNETVIPRAEWVRYPLQEADRVFVIRATQGG
jgi:sulfur carrier protein